MTNNFTNLKFSHSNSDIFIIRSAILNAVKEGCNIFDGDFLDIGCGKMPYRDFIIANSKVSRYVGLDIDVALEYDSSIKPDYTWNGINMPFGDNSFDSSMATEVLEHCPEPEVVLKEILRVLKPGGVLFFTVPFLWNLHEVPHDEYRYTPFSMKRHLENSGFIEIDIKATGGWHLAMAQMLGLWVKRSSLSKRKRKLLILILMPIQRLLIKIGKKEEVRFKEGQMIIGLYGIAKKPKMAQ
jgi:SAM-dependent methyltransferase